MKRLEFCGQGWKRLMTNRNISSNIDVIWIVFDSSNLYTIGKFILKFSKKFAPKRIPQFKLRSTYYL